MNRNDIRLAPVPQAEGVVHDIFLPSRRHSTRALRSRNGTRRGFSLLELLVVIAIIAIMVALTSLGVRSVLQGASLTAGARAVSDALQIARGRAQAGADATVVVFRTSGQAAWRRLAVFKARTGAGGDWEWSQIGPWKTLGTTAFIDPNYDAATETWTNKPDGLAGTQANLAVTLPVTALRDGNAALQLGNDFRAVAFGPGGGLLSKTGKAVAVRVASGRGSDTNIVIEGGSTPKNSVLLVIEPVTGRVKEIRD